MRGTLGRHLRSLAVFEEIRVYEYVYEVGELWPPDKRSGPHGRRPISAFDPVLVHLLVHAGPSGRQKSGRIESPGNHPENPEAPKR